MAPLDHVAEVPFDSTAGQTEGAYTFVQEELEASEQQANDLLGQFETAINNLTSTAPHEVDFSELEKNIPELIFDAFPEKPDIQLLLNTAWPDTAVAAPNYVEKEVDTSYTAPTAPAQLDPVFEFVQRIYHSEFYRPLADALLKDLTEGGTGFTEQAYQAILNRESAARGRVNDRRRVAEDRILGAGSMMPNGFSADVKLNTEADIAREDSIALANIVAKDFEITDQNTRFVKEAMQSYDMALRADFQSSEERRFNIARGIKEVALAIFAENIKKYIADWDGVQAKLDGAKIEADIITARWNAETEKHLGQIKGLEAQIELITSENKSKTDAALAESGVYSSEVQAHAVKQNALIEEVRIARDLYLADLQKVTEENKIELEAYTSAENVNAEKTVSVAQVVAQTLASVFGKTNFSVGYSGSRSSSSSMSLNNSGSESRNYSTDLSTA